MSYFTQSVVVSDEAGQAGRRAARSVYRQSGVSDCAQAHAATTPATSHSVTDREDTMRLVSTCVYTELRVLYLC